MEKSLSEAMQEERDRLSKEIEVIEKKRIDLDQQETLLKIELAGIQAYFDTKMGKVIQRQEINTKKGTRAPRQSGNRARLIELINQHPEGISKQSILEALDAKGNKAMEQAISNALANLKKDEKIASGDRGMYKPVDTAQPATPAPKVRRVKKDDDQPAAG